MRTMTAMATKIGRDGKHYPAVQPHGALPDAERAEAIRTVHHLVHGMGYTIRAAQRELAGQHGIRRSLGAIHGDLAAFTCPECLAGVPVGAHTTPAADGAW
jgi:hypothetical protein